MNNTLTTIILSLFLLFGINTYAQTFLNLDFEKALATENVPIRWKTRGKGYTINLDTNNSRTGKYSLKMHGENPAQKAFGVCTGKFPTTLAKGKNIVFKACIKTENVSKGYAGLWWRVDGENKVLGFDNMADRGLTGDTDWQEVAIEMLVDSNVLNINFGGLLTGKGTAWFDDFGIWIDGEQYKDTPARTAPPSEAELLCLKENIMPLKGFDPAETNKEDLTILGSLLKDVEIVALGEVTHGSREIFMMKHRIIKFLTEKQNFDIFSIEANMPEAYKVNSYTSEGKGDPESLLYGMHFWTWQTEEVLNMLHWMKKHNNTNPNNIQFTGFDMQYYEEAIKALKTIIKKSEKKQVEQIEAALEDLKESRKENRRKAYAQTDQNTALNKKITQLKNTLPQIILDTGDIAWAKQYLKLTQQYVDINYIKRDEFMAENLIWIKEQNPGSKIMIWAHNGHIKKNQKKMGEFLSKKFKDKYLNIGFAFHEGAYTAVGNSGLTQYPAQASYPGTYESFFAAIDVPVFLLDLRSIPKGDPACKWLFDKLEFRATGAKKNKYEFQQTQLSEDFDLVIFINKSSPSKLLRNN